MNVYKITAEDGEELYYAAESEERARREHDSDWSPVAVNVEAVPDADLDLLTVVFMDEDEAPTDEVQTFRQYMAEHGNETAYQIGG